MKRMKITIEGPDGCGKTFIRKHIESLLKEEGRPFKTYDPVYKFKPEQIDFGDAEVIIMVKTKTPKITHASDCALHNGPAYKPTNCDCGAEPGMTPEKYGSEFPINHGSATKG